MKMCDDPKCPLNRQGVYHENHESIENRIIENPCNDPRCAMNRMGMRHNIHDDKLMNNEDLQINQSIISGSQKDSTKKEEYQRWKKFLESEKIRKSKKGKVSKEADEELSDPELELFVKKTQQEEKELWGKFLESEKIREKEDEILTQTLEKNGQKQEHPIIAEEEILEKIKNQENLYDPSRIDLAEDSLSIRIFYDLKKKDSKYWNTTDLLDRIHIRDEDIRKELKIKQNKITLNISVEKGGTHRFAKLISGGNKEFWDHDTGGYYLQIHLSAIEEFLKNIIIKHIRYYNKSMNIYESKHTISAILVRDKADYVDASNILKRITRAFCDELTEMADVLIEK